MPHPSEFAGGGILVPSALTGYRTFQVRPSHDKTVNALHSVSFSTFSEWSPSVNVARCYLRETLGPGTANYRYSQTHTPEVIENNVYMRDDHELIDSRCSCGFYAYFSRENEYRMTSLANPSIHRVAAVVQVTGKTVVGSKGFRSTNAQVLAVAPIVPGPRPSRSLADLTEDVNNISFELFGDRRSLSWNVPMAVAYVYGQVAQRTDGNPVWEAHLQTVTDYIYLCAHMKLTFTSADVLETQRNELLEVACRYRVPYFETDIEMYDTFPTQRPDLSAYDEMTDDA